MGQSPPGETYNETGEGVPFFQGATDFQERFPKQRVFCAGPTRFAKEGDILFSVRAPIGRINIAPFDCSIGRGVAAIRGKLPSDTRFLEYALKSIKNEWGILEGQGAVFGNAKRSDLENLFIYWPEQSERRRIAHILGTLDDKIELNRRMNTTLEAIARAIFKSWFVDFDPVRAKAAGRPSGLPPALDALFPSRFVDSELGEIPEGWEVGKLGDSFDITMGQSPPGNTYNESGDGLPFFQGRRDFGERFPQERVFCSEPKRIAQPGDTLISVRAPVGDINMALKECCIGRGVASVRHKSDGVSYTYYLLLSLQKQLARFEAEGTVFGSVTKDGLGSLLCLAAPEGLVEQFEKIAKPKDHLFLTNHLETQTLEAIRDDLLPRLVGGVYAS